MTRMQMFAIVVTQLCLCGNGKKVGEVSENTFLVDVVSLPNDLVLALIDIEKECSIFKSLVAENKLLEVGGQPIIGEPALRSTLTVRTLVDYCYSIYFDIKVFSRVKDFIQNQIDSKGLSFIKTIKLDDNIFIDFGLEIVDLMSLCAQLLEEDGIVVGINPGLDFNAVVSGDYDNLCIIGDVTMTNLTIKVFIKALYKANSVVELSSLNLT